MRRAKGSRSSEWQVFPWENTTKLPAKLFTLSLSLQAFLLKRVRAGDEVADLCLKDSEKKLHVITEEAPVHPPEADDTEEVQQEFREKQQAFLAKWTSPVKNAYRKKKSSKVKITETLQFTHKITTTSPF